MIRGRRCASVAVRRPDGMIALRSDPISPFFTGPLRRLPLIRGVITLIETLTLGMRALIYSANVSTEAEGEEISKGAMAGVLSFSLLFAIVLFFMLPVLASKPFEDVTGSDIVGNVTEGLIRFGVFLGYIYLIGKMEQINRVFMYHGAEHMAVHAQENLDTLDVESVRAYPTAHPRCGTAFLLTVMVVATVVFTFVGARPCLVAHPLPFGPHPADRGHQLRADQVQRPALGQRPSQVDCGAQPGPSSDDHPPA